MTRRRGPRVVVLALVVMAATACAGSQGAATFDPDQPPTGPLVALPDCEDPPIGTDDPTPEGAALPDELAVSQVVPQGPITTLTGYVPTTPVNVRLGYEAREDLELIIIEDEVFESEMLVSTGTRRTYVKATAICATGSTVTAMVADELDAEGLPVPAGALDGAAGQ